MKALAGKRHCPYLPKCRHSPTVYSFNTALTCTAYVLPAIRELIKIEHVATEPNKLKLVRSGSITSKSRKHAESGRTNGPSRMQIAKQDTIDIMVDLGVEHVVNDLKQVHRSPLGGPKWNNHFETGTCRVEEEWNCTIRHDITSRKKWEASTRARHSDDTISRSLGHSLVVTTYW